MRRLWILLLLLVGCGEPVPLDPPERPAQVPETATWAGGLKGGSWFECTALDEPGLYDCTIYDDYSGDVEQSGVFATPNRVVLEEDIEYQVFTGYNIVLMDGMILKPTFDPWPEDSEEF